jgi:hypothetical protein
MCTRARAVRRLDVRNRELARWAALALSSLLTAAAITGCEQRANTRTEARALMTSLNAVTDQGGSLVERNAALERLDQLQLQVPAHVQTRDVCRAAHRGLLEAETAQAEARRALASTGALQRAEAAVIAADIERSNRALTVAKQRFPQCERAMRQLLTSAH